MEDVIALEMGTAFLVFVIVTMDGEEFNAKFRVMLVLYVVH